MKRGAETRDEGRTYTAFLGCGKLPTEAHLDAIEKYFRRGMVYLVMASLKTDAGGVQARVETKLAKGQAAPLGRVKLHVVFQELEEFQKVLDKYVVVEGCEYKVSPARFTSF